MMQRGKKKIWGKENIWGINNNQNKLSGKNGENKTVIQEGTSFHDVIQKNIKQYQVTFMKSLLLNSCIKGKLREQEIYYLI